MDKEFIREARLIQAWVCFQAAAQAHKRGWHDVRDAELDRGCEFVEIQRYADMVEQEDTPASNSGA